MTFQNPTFQKAGKYDLASLLRSYANEILKDLNCVKIGTIKSFNATLQEAKVQIAFTQVTSTLPDGTQTLAAYPLLVNVPVLFPAGGGFTLTFPIAVGDECLVLFNDRQIDEWLLSGAGKPPPTGRLHDLSDGIAIVGLRNNTRALSGVSTSSAQLRSDDGATYIDMSAGKIQLVADEVVIHGKVKSTFDADGTGFVYTAGQIDTYTNGVPVVTHGPNPPEVPT